MEKVCPGDSRRLPPAAFSPLCRDHIRSTRQTTACDLPNTISPAPPSSRKAGSWHERGWRVSQRHFLNIPSYSDRRGLPMEMPMEENLHYSTNPSAFIPSYNSYLNWLAHKKWGLRWPPVPQYNEACPPQTIHELKRDNPHPHVWSWKSTLYMKTAHWKSMPWILVKGPLYLAAWRSQLKTLAIVIAIFLINKHIARKGVGCMNFENSYTTRYISRSLCLSSCGKLKNFLFLVVYPFR